MTSSASFCRLTVEETVHKLHTSIETGLESPQDANYRRSVHGPNTLETDDDDNVLMQFISQFYEDPLILMLISSAGISLFLGNRDDAISITVAIIFVVSVGFVQEYRSEQSLKALNNLVPPSAHVTRGGETKTVLAANLVPGDLVRFSVGDRIPADVRLATANHLAIDESSLTGETVPVYKDNKVCQGTQQANGTVPISERHCIAFMGTLVTAGNGYGIVVGTGKDTEFGSIFYMMSEIDKPKTPLQNAMSKLGKDLSIVSFGVIGIICIIGVIQGRSLLEMFQIGVSLAVAAIPEGLPIIVTVTLALGVLRMAKNNAIVRRLPSVETLGSVNVVCSDKTGTLTQNKLTVSGFYTPSSNTWFDVRIRDENFTLSPSIRRLLAAANLCNDAAKVDTPAQMANAGVDDLKWIGSPVDIAILAALPLFNETDLRDKEHRIDEVPFSSSRKWMAVKSAPPHGKTAIYLKGATEKLLPLCRQYTTSDGGATELTDAIRAEVTSHADEHARQGLRIISMAYRSGDCDMQDPKDLTYAGMIAFYDPPRVGVKSSVRRLLEGSVRVIMITGDNELTAVAAAREVGIPVPVSGDASQFVINGPKLETMTPEQLTTAIQSVVIFARTSPEMKVKIVKALQRRGDIVAMTGDGVNDAPALKLADIGVSMGTGTDVAKEASDMILVNDDFSTILEAIKEGKAIFNNVKSFLSFQLSTSVAALSLVVLTTICKLPNPLNPMQILWINILMDGPPAQSLGVEGADPAVMSHPPRKKNARVLTDHVIKKVLIRGAIIVAGTMFIYVREMADGLVTARDTTMTFTCFVLFDLFNALASRSATRSVFELGIFSNKMFNLAVGCSFLGQLAVIYVPFLQEVFQTEALSFKDILFLVCFCSSVWWVDELLKMEARKKQLDYTSSIV